MESAVTILLVCLVMMMTFMVDQYIHDSKYDIPEGFPAICLGLVLGAADWAFGQSAQDLFTFNSELFQLVLLPPIIFDAGFSLKKQGMFNNFGTIMLFAFVGTLISTLAVGLVTWHMIGGDLVECLMFGTLISAIDPVSSLAIMGEVFQLKGKENTPLVYNLVFGESLFNDGVCMVLFFALEKQLEQHDPAGTAILKITAGFFMVFFFSCFLGIGVGMVTALIFKYTNLNHNVSYMLFGIFFMSLSSFMLSEYFGLSGIIAVFFCGIVQSHYTFHNLSTLGRVTVPRVFHAFAATAETFVFNYLGMALFAFRGDHDFDFAFIGVVLGVCFGARAVSVFGLTPFANCLRKHNKIDIKKQILMWFSGLRGAIAFALAVELLHVEVERHNCNHEAHNATGVFEDEFMDGEVINEHAQEDGSECLEWLQSGTDHSHIFMTTTLITVVFTTVLCGFLTTPLLKGLGLDQEESPNYHESKKSRLWAMFDAKFFDPLLLTDGRCGSDEEANKKLGELQKFTGHSRHATFVIGTSEGYDEEEPEEKGEEA